MEVSVNYTVIGRCSCCGGEVRALSGAWMSVTPPPPPTCASCGAQALGPVVQTTPVTRLGRREGETTAEAARRVVAERDALQGHWCLACGGTGQWLGLHPCDACQGGAR